MIGPEDTSVFPHFDLDWASQWSEVAVLVSRLSLCKIKYLDFWPLERCCFHCSTSTYLGRYK